MKKVWYGLAALLLGCSLTYGSEADVRRDFALDQTNQMLSSLREAYEQVIQEPTSQTPDTPPPTVAPQTVQPQTAQTQTAQPQPAIPQTVHLPPVHVLPVQEPETVWIGNGNGNGYTNGNGNGITNGIGNGITNGAANGNFFIHSELERLSSAVESLQKPATPTNTRNSWGAPRLSGRIFVDSANVIDQNAASREGNGNFHNSAGLRDLRLGVTGSGYESFDYRAEFSYTAQTGNVTLTDVWIGAQNIPLLGYLRVGHMRPETGQYFPMGSQNLTSMWYPSAGNAFGLGRRIGITSQHLFADDRIRLAFGVYQSEPTQDTRFIQRDNQGQTVNLRLSGTPVFEEDGKYLFHIGGHWAYVGAAGASGPNNDNPIGRQSSASIAPGQIGPGNFNTLTTGTFANEYSNRGGLELAYQNNRFSVRSEYYVASFGAHTGRTSAPIPSPNNRKMHGAYVELAYFLTDGYRIYNPSSGLFTGVKTNSNFRPLKSRDHYIIDGIGAWQSFFQWSYTDMTDWRTEVVTTNTAGEVTNRQQVGGHQNDFTAGLNWYWTPQLRWVFQYIHSKQSVGTDYSKRSQDIFGTGFRVHF